MNRAKTFWAALGILLIAFAFRVLAIEAMPQGYTHDEFGDLDVAAQVRQGDWQLLYAGGFAIDGSEPAYFPVLSAAQSIWGTSSFARRLPSVFAGMIGLCLSYALARRMFGARVGLITLSIASVTWWSILIGHFVLRESLELPPYALAVYAFWRGFESARADRSIAWRSFAIGGLALGAAQYVHTIPRGLFLVFVLFGLYLLLFHRSIFKRAWRGIAISVIVAELIAAPLLIYAYSNPDLDHLPSLTTAEVDPNNTLSQHFLDNTPTILGQFMFKGDDTWEFNLPDRPIFDPLAAGLFGLGLLIAVWHLRQPEYAFSLIAISISLLPSILLDPNFPFARMLSAQVIAFAFVGVGLNSVLDAIRRILLGRAYSIGLIVLAGGVIGFSSIKTIQDMYVTWPSLYQVRWTYNSEYVHFFQYLNAQPQPPAVSECALWIVYPWRPRYHAALVQDALQHVTQRTDLNIRWQDCRYALVIPSGGQFILAHPDLEPLSDFLGRYLNKPWLTGAQPIAGIDGALQVDARSALAEQQAQWNQLSIAWPPEATTTPTTSLPVDFDHAIDLIGYKIKPQTVKPGDTLAVITYWRVKKTLPADLVVFAHLYRTPDEVLAQQDQLDVAPDSLQPGDVFMQQHEFITVPPDTVPGQYWLGIGVYHKDVGSRLPIFAGDQRVADRIFLTQVRVQP
jgi:hypothetical protein